MTIVKIWPSKLYFWIFQIDVSVPELKDDPLVKRVVDIYVILRENEDLTKAVTKTVGDSKPISTNNVWYVSHDSTVWLFENFTLQLFVYNFTNIFFLQNCIVIEAALEPNIPRVETYHWTIWIPKATVHRWERNGFMLFFSKILKSAFCKVIISSHGYFYYKYL